MTEELSPWQERVRRSEGICTLLGPEGFNCTREHPHELPHVATADGDIVEVWGGELTGTCARCGQVIGWVDCPTGGWWSHHEHPSDDHDADPDPIVIPEAYEPLDQEGAPTSCVV